MEERKCGIQSITPLCIFSHFIYFVLYNWKYTQKIKSFNKLSKLTYIIHSFCLWFMFCLPNSIWKEKREVFYMKKDFKIITKWFKQWYTVGQIFINFTNQSTICRFIFCYCFKLNSLEVSLLAYIGGLILPVPMNTSEETSCNIQLCRSQVCKSTIYHLYIALCVHFPKSKSDLLSLYIWTPSPWLLYNPTLCLSFPSLHHF